MRKIIRLIVAIMLSAMVFAGVAATVQVVRKSLQKEEITQSKEPESEEPRKGLTVLPMPEGDETAGWGEVRRVSDATPAREWTKSY